MSKRKRIGVRHRCAACFSESYHAKCPRCGKPSIPVRDKNDRVRQETLE